jgi:hypothetical protein
MTRHALQRQFPLEFGPPARFSHQHGLFFACLSVLLITACCWPLAAAGQACTSYVLVSAFDNKTGQTIPNLTAGDFQAKLGKSSADIISATQPANDRLLVLLQTDGTSNEKIEDLVASAIRLARETPEGKPVAFGVFVKRWVFTKQFETATRRRAAAISEVAEEESTLGQQVHLYDALLQGLAVFGMHEPGDAVLVITDGYDDGSDHSAEEVEKEYVRSGTRLFVLLRRGPSHVGGNYMWRSPERMIHQVEKMSATTGGTYTMFSSNDFAFPWQSYKLGIRLPETAAARAKLNVRLQGMAAITYRHPHLHYPERIMGCPTEASATTAAAAPH